MKSTIMILILILVLAVLIIAGSCATGKKAISDEDFIEVWSGTWINTDYGGGNFSQKRINYPDGTCEMFGQLTSTIVGYKEKITILEQWVDSKGTIWYRGHYEAFPPYAHTGYAMGKISDSGNTQEIIFASESYPIEEWEPDKFEYNYRIYYRQE